MAAYSFQARFIVPICDGTKRQTIRHPRRCQTKPGWTLQLYYAQRSTFRRLPGTAICASVRPVSLNIHPNHGAVYFRESAGTFSGAPFLDGFAVRDGFSGWTDLCGFWAEVHRGVAPFQGDLIEWTDFTPSPAL